MAETDQGGPALTGFEGYSTETLLRIAGNIASGLDRVIESVETDTLHVRPKPGAATPKEAGFGFVMLRDGINQVLAQRGEAVEDDRNPHSVQQGQIWQDNDKRVESWRGSPRLIKVEVIDLAAGKAVVFEVDRTGARIDAARTTKISLKRFVPTSTGYLRRADLDR